MADGMQKDGRELCAAVTIKATPRSWLRSFKNWLRPWIRANEAGVQPFVVLTQWQRNREAAW